MTRGIYHHHHYHLSLNREGRWGTIDDFATSFLHFPLFSTALCDLANSRPVHSMMLSPHLFFCLPCLLPPFTVPCKMVLDSPDEQETWPYHCSLHLFTMVRSTCGQLPAGSWHGFPFQEYLCPHLSQDSSPLQIHPFAECQYHPIVYHTRPHYVNLHTYKWQTFPKQIILNYAIDTLTDLHHIPY